MDNNEYIRRVLTAYLCGKISENTYREMVINSDIFCKEESEL